MAVADVPGLMDIARYGVLACRSKIRNANLGMILQYPGPR